MTISYHYDIEIPEGAPRRLTIGWLSLALGSLVMGGVLTILIVLSRTPGIQEIVPWIDFFHTAIVVHVDLTVLVWFLAFAGVLWSLSGSHRGGRWGWWALWLCVAGAAIFAASPFLGAGDPLMNNYVPVLQNPIFFAGLGLFGVGFSLLVLRGLAYSRLRWDINNDGVLRFGLYTGLLAAVMAMTALGASYVLMPDTLSGQSYYELLFWGGGHVLQFTHTQLMLIVWLWLASVSGAALGLSPKVVLALLALGFAPVLLAPVIYFLYDVGSAEHLSAFTRLMEYGGGLAALPLGLAMTIGIIRAKRASPERSPERMALICSIGLFAAGGVIGFLIREVNVTIPAHYHGSIVAVTLAFMGLTYHLLPRLGFQMPSPRLARLQPALYGGGQLMHVLGLAWSGGYGVQRKTAGVAQGLHGVPEIAGMALMGLGGLIAVIGGLMFLVIVIKAMWLDRSVRRSAPVDA